MDLAERIDPTTTALLVVDVQNDFCHPDGVYGAAHFDLSSIDPAVDRILGLVESAKACEVPVIYAWTTHADVTDTPQWRARRSDHLPAQTCEAGSWGAELYRLDPDAADARVEKHRYSAFAGTTLEPTLHELGRRHLVVCGVATHICVETTVREGVCRDYVMTMASDACAAYDGRSHRRSLEVVAKDFGLVIHSAHLRRAWANGNHDSR